MTVDEPETTTTTQKRGAFLIADCGTVNTTVTLFDVVNGAYRLIAQATAPTTVAAPWSDIMRGIHQAVQHITTVTGRPLLNDQGTLIKPAKDNGAGVDKFAAVISAASPLTTLLVGLFDDVSLASARRALHTVYAHEIDTFSLADTRSEEEQVEAILRLQPDLIFIVGGTEGGANQRLMRLVETISLGLKMLPRYKRTFVLFAGNTNLRERVLQVLGDAGVQMADNVRPDLEVEQLEDAVRVVNEMYEDIKLPSLPGIQEIVEWGSFDSISTVRAFTAVTRYFAALHKTSVLAVDVGAESTTLVTANADKVKVVVNSRLGIGRSVANLLTCVQPGSIAAWVPSAIDDARIKNFILHKAVYPQTIPMTEEELHLEQAVVRELLRCAVVDMADRWGLSNGQLPPFNLLLVHGAVFTGAARPGQIILMLLDALQPTGIFSVALDRHNLLPALGALVTHEPVAMVQALEAGVLADLGWVVAPVGKAQPGHKVLNVTIESERSQQLTADIEYGTLEVLPLPPGQSTVTLKPTRRFDIGLGPGKSTRVVLHSGALGLVIDARGRPLSLPQDEVARYSLVRQWLWDMGG